MVLLRKITLIIVLIGSALGKQGSLLNPCNVDDMACLSKSTEQFLNNTAKGIPQYDIRAIDPMVIPTVESDFKTVKYTFKNVTLLGLKDLKIADFKMDLNAKTVMLKTNINVRYNCIIDMDYKKPEKSISGSYSGSGRALMTSVYPYSIRTDDKNVEYFEVGKEVISCEPLVADANISKELSQQFEKDAEILCTLLDIAYPSVIHNIRAAARILPKTAFFKNM